MATRRPGQRHKSTFPPRFGGIGLTPEQITTSAFVGTPLDIVLCDCGIESFAIVGIALEIGSEPTMRHAMASSECVTLCRCGRNTITAEEPAAISRTLRIRDNR